MYELVKVDGLELSTKLAKKLNVLNNAIATIGRNTWKVAKAVTEIVEEDDKGNALYMNDFKNMKELCNFMGMSQGQISKFKKAVYLNEEYELAKDGFSLSQVIELSYAKDVVLDNFIMLNNITCDMKCVDIREIVKEHNDSLKKFVGEDSEEVTEESEEVTEESEEVTEESEEVTEERYHTIVVDDKEIIITTTEYNGIVELLLKYGVL